MKKLIILMLNVISIQVQSQVVVTGENLTKDKFDIYVLVNNDTIYSKENCKKGYSINFPEEKEFTVIFSSKENEKVIKIHTYHKKLWFNLDIDLSTSNSATLIYDPEKHNYIMITKMGSEIPILKD